VVEYEEVIIVAAVIGAAAGLTSIGYNIYTTTTKSRQAAAFEKMGSHMGDLVAALKEDIESMRREVGVLRDEVRGRETTDALAIEQQQQELAQRKQEHSWNQLAGVAKGVGWIMEHGDLFETDDDDDY